MVGRRLEYHSLTTVLLHMDANVRFKISLHMPSIRSTEKVVPLKMNYFYMDQTMLNVNDTLYQLRIVRYYPDATPPKKDDEGGWNDYDEFGFRVDSGSNVLLPGDVRFQSEKPSRIRVPSEENERVYRDKVRVYEKALKILDELKSKGVDVNTYLRSLERVSDEEENAVRDAVRGGFLTANSIDGYRTALKPFDCRRNNTKPEFTCYIRLKITGGRNKYVEWLEYDKKLFEACKHLYEVLFGGRTMPIRVEEFSLDYDRIYRLPVGFRLQVQKAAFSQQMVTHQNFPLIVDFSGRMSSLTIYRIYGKDLQPDAYKVQIARNAKRLIIGDVQERDLEGLSQVIREVLNPEICILPWSLNCVPMFYFTNVQSWLDGGRPVGASLWMKTLKATAINVSALIEKQYEENRKSERGVSVRLGNSTGLEVLFVRCEEPEEDQREEWMLKMYIVQV